MVYRKDLRLVSFIIFASLVLHLQPGPYLNLQFLTVHIILTLSTAFGPLEPVMYLHDLYFQDCYLSINNEGTE